MEPISEVELRRLRWHCRRGRLENDLVLEKFLIRFGGKLDRTRLDALNELLELGDNELWDLVAGRTEPPEPRHTEIVGWLRLC
jgi:succinate dehydrogenase flavin-adding protein (antitoxin of CptAB toxin-antitoxin module)